MRVANGDIWAVITAQPPESSPLQEVLAERWPVKTAYWLARLAKKLQGHQAVIDQVRVALIQQHGVPKANGLGIQPGDPSWEQFAAAYNELMNEEVELGIDRIVLPETNGCELKASTLLALMPFVDVAGMESASK